MLRTIAKLTATGAAALAALLAVANVAQADASDPGGVDWQFGYQEAVSPTMHSAQAFNSGILIAMTLVTIFVLALLIYVIIAFNAKANPTPRRFSHNTIVEVVWTVVPIIILVFIALPSMQILYQQDEIPEADMTIKAIGYQWFWGYEYPDHGDIVFDALMLEDDEAEAQGLPRLLATDYPVVVPVDTTVKVLVTAEDVIHNWAMPSMAIKMDAVPGRLNETWFLAEKEGTYYGQCSELCGVRHAYMPIMLKVVSKEAFEEWAARAAEDLDDAAEFIVAYEAERDAKTKLAAAATAAD